MAYCGSELVNEVAKLNQMIEEQKFELIEEATKHAEDVAQLKQTIEDQKSELIVKSSDHAAEAARLNQIVGKKETEMKAQILKNSVLSKKVDKLEGAAKTIEEAGLFGKLVQLAKSSTTRLILDLYRKNVDYEYELCDLDAFLESKANRYSDYFFAGGLAWYLALEPANKDEINCLKIHLYAEDYAGSDGGKWHVKVDFSLSIVNQSKDQKKTSDFTGAKDFNETGSGWGWDKFISIKDLRDGGYVKNNEIRVQASLKVVGDLIRTE